MNPLLEQFNTEYGALPFDKIKEKHYLPALRVAIEESKAIVETIKSGPASFTETIEKLSTSGEKIEVISAAFFNLNSADTNDEMQKIAQEFSPILTKNMNDVLLDAGLFAKIKEVYESRDGLDLDIEQKMLLDKTYKSFINNGANLDDAQKTSLREIDSKLSKLGVKFSQNVLKETNDFEMIIVDESDLAGLPEGVREASAMEAKNTGKEGWLFNLQYPSYIPFMKYAENRELKEKIYRAFCSKAFNSQETANNEIIKSITNLRHERSRLLDCKSHAEHTLKERMASSPDKVNVFLNDLLNKAKPAAIKELEELKEFAKDLGFEGKLKKWDFSYYTEKLKQKKYALDDETLKPYFKLENVVDGVFAVAKKLYQLNFKKISGVPLYHEDVSTYEVSDNSGKFVGLLYTDFFPRESKQSGAWMTQYINQCVHSDGNEQRPHVSIVCNFTKPTETKPSLLTFDELTTLFHEFGHALHGLLSQCRYSQLSGPNVYWDFVELPSQILENWCYEKKCLDLFATHYETGEKIPSDLVERLKKSATFMEAPMTIRQVGLGLLDMAWHAYDPKTVNNIEEFENKTMAPTALWPPVDGTNISCSFSHIFAGGYSAGYYSYKWAEVLDADAFELFKERGIFNNEVATSFKENILSRGGSEHPMELYKRFRGKEPSVDALLRRGGLL